MTDKDEEEKVKDKGLWRDLVAFWILGLCNNYGYVVMLSAAYDIIGAFASSEGTAEVHQALNETAAEILGKRVCNPVSVGVVLLADVVPELIVKIIIPYVPFWANIRIAVAIAFSVLGFLLVAFAHRSWVAILGVISTSINVGIGESTFLAYTPHFNKNVISTWSSGTGGAGILGSLSYASLRSLGLSPRNTMLSMLVVPLCEVLAFWVLLRRPSFKEEIKKEAEDERHWTLKEKILYVKQVWRYQIPLGLVYFFEYLINQGLLELFHFKNTFISKAGQYRWYMVDYQVGVFISRSSVNIVQFRRLWIMSVLQGINVVIVFLETFFFFLPTIWLAFLLVLWEGLLGGGSYVNTFYRMAIDVPKEEQPLAMSLVVQSNALGISAAGFIAIPIHNAICRMSAPKRLYEFPF